MKKSRLISISIPFFLLAVFVVLLTNPGKDSEPELKTAETDSSTATRSTPEASEPIAPISDPEPFVREKITRDTLSIATIKQEEWETIRERRDLSIAPKREFIRSSLPVRVNLQALTAAREKAFSRLLLDLGTGGTEVAEIATTYNHGTDAYSFSGRMEGVAESEFSISVYKDAVVGTFSSPDFGVRQLRFVADGIHRVDEIDPSLAPGCAHPLTENLLANATPRSDGISAGNSTEFPLDGIRMENRHSFEQFEEDGANKTDGGVSTDEFDGATELDVLIAYTQATIANEGSLNATLALINQGVVDTNTAFQNSNIDAVLRLVGTTEVTYTGTGASAALNAFRSTSDGSMDEIHSLRNSLGADFVSLWIPLSDYCGIASLITTLSTSQDYRAFSVCDPDCQFQYTFTHELGHNWGSAHAVGDSGTTRGRGMFDYSHGWRWDTGNGGQNRSILAYSPGTRVRQFSDPDVLYNGQIPGRTNLEDNARSISEIKGTMSLFRTSGIDDHGDTTDTATSVPTSSTTSGVLDDASDLDMFRIQLSTTTDFAAATSGTTNTRGRLLNSFGVAIESDTSSGDGNNFAFSRQLSAGIYYVEVSSEANSTGSYQFVVSSGGGDDHGNNILSATSISPNSSTIGSLEEGGDEDFFRINIPASGTLTVSTTGSTDTYGYLQNSSGATLASDDDSGSSLNFQIVRTLTPGTYYVRLTGFSSFTTGNYTLTASFDGIPDDHANSFTEATGVTPGTTASPSVTAGNFETIGDVDFLRFTLLGTNDQDLDEADVQQVTLDITQIGTYPYTEDGFTLAPFPGGRFSVINNNTSSGFPPGSYVRLLFGDSLEITHDAGELFDVVSIDLAEYSTVFQSPQTLSWTGHKPDGTTVTHTVVTDGIMDGTGPADDFETFAFPSSFSGLTKLVAGNSNVFNADNFVLRTGSTTIPTGTLSIYSSGSTDTVGTLYNSSFASVATDDNGGTGMNFAINRADFPTGTYYLRVSEFGNNGTGTYNIHIGYDQILPIPVPPSGFTATTSDDSSVNLQWDAVQGATFYSIYRNSSPDFSSSVKIGDNLTSTVFSDTTAVAGESYTYWVTASNSSGESAPSASVIGGRAYERPQIFSHPASKSIPGGSSTVLEVTAQTSIGALSYQWFQGLSGDTSIPVGPDSDTFATPVLNEDSNFWVRVSNGFNHRDSETAAITLLLAPPPLVSASQGSLESGIQVRWVPVNQSNSYSIYRALSNDSTVATKIATTTETSFLDTTAVAGNTYYYFVRVTNSAGNESSSSGGSTNSGFVSGGALIPDFIPGAGFRDLAYSGDGSLLYTSGDSGWVDAFNTTTEVLSQWAGINEPLLGLDVIENRVLAAGSGIDQQNGALFDIDFSGSAPLFIRRPIALTSGDTGLHSVAFSKPGFAFVTARSGNSSTSLREIDLGINTLAIRNDIPTGGNVLAPDSFLERSIPGTASPAGSGGNTYENDFELETGSLNGFTIGEVGTGTVQVENGKLRLNPGSGYLNRAYVSIPLDTVLPQFDSHLDNSTGLVTIAFNVRNQDNGMNNSYGVGIGNKPDPSDSTNFYYEMGGGGYGGDQMRFLTNSHANSPFGPGLNSLLIENNGLAPNSEGAFRITYEPQSGVWTIFYEAGPVAVDALSITTQIATFTDRTYTDEELPWLILRSQNIGAVFFDNIHVSIAGNSGADSADGVFDRIGIFEGGLPGTGRFSYSPDSDEFTAEAAATSKIESAAISSRSGATALALQNDTVVFDASGAQVATIATSGNPAFSPTHDHLYILNKITRRVEVYSTLTWSEISSLSVPGDFANTTGQYGSGRIKVHPNGEQIAVITDTGIRLLDPTYLHTDGLPATAPLEHTFSGATGGPNGGKTKSFTLTNNHSYKIDWAATIDVNWLTLSSSSGTILAGNNLSLTVSTTPEADLLPEGNHVATLTLTNPDSGAELTRSITLVTGNSAALPLYEDFEDVLSSYWETSSTLGGRMERTGDHSPVGGNFHLLMDSQNGNALNELTLTVNLDGVTGAELRFRAEELGEERHVSPSTSFTGSRNFDGVAISDDGIEWHPVLSFPDTFTSHADFYINLDQEIAARGLEKNSSFKIRFSQYDNLPAPNDGILFDDIEVTTAADRAQPGQISITSSGNSVANGSTLDLGAIPKSQYQFLVLSNTGSGALRDIDHSNSALGDFAGVFETISRILPGNSTTIAAIRADELGTASGTIRIDSNDPDDNPFTFDITALSFQSITQWRLEHFGSTANSGTGADLNDHNSDGATNLESFAYGRDPNQFNPVPIQVTSVTDTELVARYQRNLSAVGEGITFTVEWKDNLNDPTWSSVDVSESVVSTTGGNETVEVTIPRNGSDHKFLRLTISQ